MATLGARGGLRKGYGSELWLRVGPLGGSGAWLQRTASRVGPAWGSKCWQEGSVLASKQAATADAGLASCADPIRPKSSSTTYFQKPCRGVLKDNNRLKLFVMCSQALIAAQSRDDGLIWCCLLPLA